MVKHQTKFPAQGIRRTPTGFQIYVQVGGRFISEVHPKTALLGDLKARREEMKVEARKEKAQVQARAEAHRGSLAADVNKYLAQVASMATIKFRERDLNTWLERFGDRPRASLKASEIRAQLQEWRTVGPTLRYKRKKGGGEWVRLERGLSASACNHRRTALLHLYTILDGKAAPNPVREVSAFVEPPPEPRGRPLELLKRIVDRVPNPKSRARLKVLMWTGMRGNSELGKMRPEHVDLDSSVCHVPTAKGGKHYRLVPLNEDGVAAWKEFSELDAWGLYDKENLRSALRRAAAAEVKAAIKEKRDVPRIGNLRVYDLRHSVATELLKNGADLADVQDFLGHTTTRMTRRYAPFQRAKLTAALDRLKTTA